MENTRTTLSALRASSFGQMVFGQMVFGTAKKPDLFSKEISWTFSNSPSAYSTFATPFFRDMDNEIEPMNAEQITTVVSNLITSGGVIFYLWTRVRALKSQISEMNK